MVEKIIEKVKEYKIVIALSLLGVILAGFFILNGKSENQPSVHQLTQEVVADSEIRDNEKTATREESDKVSENVEKEIELTVDVKGAVKHPGIYQLSTSSRVNDAIQKAGGLTTDADRNSINLAQKLTDEAVIYVATVGEQAPNVAGTASTGTTPSSSTNSGKVNLNTATLAELQTISGIGQKRAQDILDYREANGSFHSIEDLKNVSGVGAKTIEKLRDYVTVD